MRYVVFRRFRARCFCGNVNFPYGTVCESQNGFISKDGNSLVLTESELAHQYFARDDDGCGLERGKLTQEILEKLNPYRDPKKEAARQKAWGRIWNDPKISKFRMREHADHWLWNHAFFNADISDLKYILSIIQGGT